MARAREILEILLPLMSLFRRKKLNAFLEDAAIAVEMIDGVKAIRDKVASAHTAGQGLTLDPFETSELNMVFRYTDKLADRIESLRRK